MAEDIYADFLAALRKLGGPLEVLFLDALTYMGHAKTQARNPIIEQSMYRVSILMAAARLLSRVSQTIS